MNTTTPTTDFYGFENDDEVNDLSNFDNYENNPFEPPVILFEDYELNSDDELKQDYEDEKLPKYVSQNKTIIPLITPLIPDHTKCIPPPPPNGLKIIFNNPLIFSPQSNFNLNQQPYNMNLFYNNPYVSQNNIFYKKQKKNFDKTCLFDDKIYEIFKEIFFSCLPDNLKYIFKLNDGVNGVRLISNVEYNKMFSIKSKKKKIKILKYIIKEFEDDLNVPKEIVKIKKDSINELDIEIKKINFEKNKVETIVIKNRLLRLKYKDFIKYCLIKNMSGFDFDFHSNIGLFYLYVNKFLFEGYKASVHLNITNLNLVSEIVIAQNNYVLSEDFIMEHINDPKNKHKNGIIFYLLNLVFASNINFDKMKKMNKIRIIKYIYCTTKTYNKTFNRSKYPTNKNHLRIIWIDNGKQFSKLCQRDVKFILLKLESDKTLISKTCKKKKEKIK